MSLVTTMDAEYDSNGQGGRQLIERALHEITQLSPPKQAAVGGLSGM